jgi:hypothetical protein
MTADPATTQPGWCGRMSSCLATTVRSYAPILRDLCTASAASSGARSVRHSRPRSRGVGSQGSERDTRELLEATPAAILSCTARRLRSELWRLRPSTGAWRRCAASTASPAWMAASAEPGLDDLGRDGLALATLGQDRQEGDPGVGACGGAGRWIRAALRRERCRRDRRRPGDRLGPLLPRQRDWPSDPHHAPGTRLFARLFVKETRSASSGPRAQCVRG